MRHSINGGSEPATLPGADVLRRSEISKAYGVSRWLALFLALSLAGGAPALAQTTDAPDPGSATPLAEPRSPIDRTRYLIPRDQLSTQESDPYLFLGRVMDNSRPRWNDYKRAIKDYPTVLSCLARDQRDKERPDLLQFDWQGLNKRIEMEVCLFRVFRSLKDPKLIEDWLVSFEFKFLGYRPTGLINALEVTRLDANWTGEQYYATTGANELFPLMTWRILPRASIFSLAVFFDQNADITDISLAPIVK